MSEYCTECGKGGVPCVLDCLRHLVTSGVASAHSHRKQPTGKVSTCLGHCSHNWYCACAMGDCLGPNYSLVESNLRDVKHKIEIPNGVTARGYGQTREAAHSGRETIFRTSKEVLWKQRLVFWNQCLEMLTCIPCSENKHFRQFWEDCWVIWSHLEYRAHIDRTPWTLATHLLPCYPRITKPCRPSLLFHTMLRFEIGLNQIQPSP